MYETRSLCLAVSISFLSTLPRGGSREHADEKQRADRKNTQSAGVMFRSPLPGANASFLARPATIPRAGCGNGGKNKIPSPPSHWDSTESTGFVWECSPTR
jgi:hypothetical protein